MAGCLALPPTVQPSATGALFLPSACVFTGRHAFAGFALQRCVGAVVGSMVRTQGPEKIGTALCISQRLLSAELLSDCHMVAHAVGEAAAEWHTAGHPILSWFAEAWPAAFLERWMVSMSEKLLPSCPAACTDGCMHAVLIQLVLKALRAGAPPRPALIAKVCTLKHAPKRLTDYAKGLWEYGCVHGLGHGLGAAVTLGLVTIPEAESHCDQFFAASSERRNCKVGFLMEVVDSRIRRIADAAAASGGLPHARAWVVACQEVPATLLPSCWDMLGEGLMFSSCHDLNLSQAACAATPSPLCLRGAKAEAHLVSRTKAAVLDPHKTTGSPTCDDDDTINQVLAAAPAIAAAEDNGRSPRLLPLLLVAACLGVTLLLCKRAAYSRRWQTRMLASEARDGASSTAGTPNAHMMRVRCMLSRYAPRRLTPRAASSRAHGLPRILSRARQTRTRYAGLARASTSDSFESSASIGMASPAQASDYADDILE
jgi:hypothetical protein